MKFRLSVGVAVLGVIVSCAGPAAPGAAGEEPPAKNSELLAGLAEVDKCWQARQAAPKEETAKHHARFLAALQQVAGHLPAVAPETAVPTKYTKLTLNAGKLSVDAFRFKAPEGKANWDLDWEYVVPPGTVQSWYILPREGTMEGFQFFRHAANYREPGADLPNENKRFIQPLHGGILKPGAEYVIWFAFHKNEPVDVHIRLRLTPAGTDQDVYKPVGAEQLKTKVPASFSFDYKANPEPGKRAWTRTDDTTWVERYPSGKTVEFRVLGGATVDGVEGIVVVQADTRSLLVFIPDKTAEKPMLKFRPNMRVGPWLPLGEMTLSN